MKINMNIERLVANALQPQALNPNFKGINTEAALPVSSQTLQSLSKKRTFIDAIIIAQIAQSFFQKAILISSELKSIASEAIVSGNMKERELTDILTGARSTLNELQEAPQIAANLNYMTIYQYTGIKIDIPDITKELNSLDIFAKELSAGTIPNLKSIDRIKDSLTTKISALNSYYNQFIEELDLSSRLNSAMKNADLIANTINRIINSPQDALNSQGNISHELAKSLL